MSNTYNVYTFDDSIRKDNDMIEIYNFINTKFCFDKNIIKKCIYNSIACQFKHTIFSIYDQIGLLHYSFVIKKCRKFTFLRKNDYVIGPCWTRKDNRGKGIYSAVINYIGKLYKNINNESNIYILVRRENNPSVRGIEKANFKLIGTVEKSRYFKQYSNITYHISGK